MPSPDFLLVENFGEETFIYRFTSAGADGGDTWHEKLEHAREQIQAEYPGMTSDWIEVPEDCPDSIKFGLAHVNERKQ